MRLPSPRGPISAAIADALRRRSPDLVAVIEEARNALAPVAVLDDEDGQLALWMLYELHYQGFSDVPDQVEWRSDLIAARTVLESGFEDALRSHTRDQVDSAIGDQGSVEDRLIRLIDDDNGPSLAHYVQRRATKEQALEFLVQRSIYHLKESDQHCWVIPRLTGVAKARLVELQYDEYGAGRPDRVHAAMFARSLQAAGLCPDYGAYIERVPAATLAVNNAMSLFGLNRRLRGAAMGHLAAFESTSSLPCRRYAIGLRRLGMDEEVAAYFDEHVEADAVHEQLAVREICAPLAEQEPALLEDIFFGAAVCVGLDARVADQTLSAWDAGHSSLLEERGAVA